jgi:hypothetical protein
MTTFVPIPLADSALGEHRHVCAFFDSPDEEYRIMFPFIREALRRGERNVSILPRSRGDFLDRLRAAGIDVDAAQGAGQLELLCSEETYAADGHMDAAAMLARVDAVFEEGHSRGFALTRLSGHGESALHDPTNLDGFLEYEARLTDLVSRGPDAVVCLYDVHQISAGVAFEVLKTHPMTIVGGVLQENPFFIPPAEFLALLHDRAERGGSERSIQV